MIGSEIVYIGIGSNLNNPKAQVRSALKALRQLSSNQNITYSSLYRSKPLAGMKQPDYINAVARLETTLDAHQLLDRLQSIETQQGRVRTEQRWTARTLDLDILLYGDAVIHDSRLQIPHAGLKERNFVIYPLAELDPELKLPDNSNLSMLVAQCSTEGLEKLE